MSEKYALRETDNGMAVLRGEVVVAEFFGPEAEQNARAFAGLPQLTETARQVHGWWMGDGGLGGLGQPRLADAIEELGRLAGANREEVADG